MNDLKQAADEIRRQALKWEGLLAAAKELDRVGSIEQLAQEAEGRRSIAVAQETEAKTRLVNALKALDKAELDAKGIADVAKMSGEAIVAKARMDADAIKAEAKKAAESIVTAAQSVEMNLSASIQDKRKLLADLGKEVSEKEAKLTALKLEMKALAGKLG